MSLALYIYLSFGGVLIIWLILAGQQFESLRKAIEVHKFEGERYTSDLYPFKKYTHARRKFEQQVWSYFKEPKTEETRGVLQRWEERRKG